MLWYVVYSFPFWGVCFSSPDIIVSSIVPPNYFCQSVQLGMVGWSPESRSSRPSPMIGNLIHGRVGQFIAFPSSPADSPGGNYWVSSKPGPVTLI
ncbi:hypothetical protein BDV39DRAFT_184295 [Aspergillus sergii]|uniref:Uncharacterized protein n=1 Tax=Aspergillus sergii TaxID=1034303 RepID=A0A5N6WN63_9EURO|nr:hypothetical protein BDV39DRAFT_184295 [Aspergillus sergii]